jgi:hypothetical protein
MKAITTPKLMPPFHSLDGGEVAAHHAGCDRDAHEQGEGAGDHHERGGGAGAACDQQGHEGDDDRVHGEAVQRERGGEHQEGSAGSPTRWRWPVGRANLVVTRKEGSTVYYSLTGPDIAELLMVARTILSGVLAGQAELLADLRAAQTQAKPPP